MRRRTCHFCGIRHFGFTLVELLVVTGIIALLIGILMPVLGRAREHGRAALCASQMQQICQAVLMYASENKGALPLAGGLPASLAPVDAQIFGIRIMDFGRLDFEEGALWPYLGPSAFAREQLFSCPSDIEPRFARQYLLPKSDQKYPRNFSYNFSAYMGGSPSRVPVRGPEDWRPLRLTQVRRASHKIMAVEEEMPRSSSGSPLSAHGPNDGSDPEAPAIVVLLTKRHLGKANEAFFDGHVELVDPDIFRGDAPDITSVDAFQIYVNVFADR